MLHVSSHDLVHIYVMQRCFRHFKSLTSNSIGNIAAKWSQFQYTLYCKYIDYECEIAKNKVKLQVTKDYR